VNSRSGAPRPPPPSTTTCEARFFLVAASLAREAFKAVLPDPVQLRAGDGRGIRVLAERILDGRRGDLPDIDAVADAVTLSSPKRNKGRYGAEST